MPSPVFGDQLALEFIGTGGLYWVLRTIPERDGTMDWVVHEERKVEVTEEVRTK